MQLGEIWGWVTAVALGVGLAATAGLRAWLPLLLAGGLARLGVVSLGESFGFLSSTPALVLFAVATVVEIVADKIPAVDHVLDVISTVVRPAAGALLAASALYQVNDPLIAAVIGICVGAPVALGPHAAKSALRAASSATTAGFANPIVSFIEDGVAIALFVLAVVVPVVSLLLVVMVAWWVIRRRRRKLAVAPA